MRKTNWKRIKINTTDKIQEKVDKLANSDPKNWWRNIKDIIGTARSDPSKAFLILANETADGDFSLFANKINQFLFSVSADFPPITPDNTYLTYTPNQPIDDKYLVTVDVEKQLMNVKPGKATGPDGIQAWMFRDLAPILASPYAAFSIAL